MTHAFHKFWLKITALVVGAFGPVFLAGTLGSSDGLARFTLDLISWPIDGTTSLEAPETRLLLSLSSGFLMGWGVTIWCLSAWVYDHAPEAVRRTVLIGILGWYAFDSTGSTLSGNAVNVFFNTLLLFLAIGPMWRPAKKGLTTSV
jgi:hypothetical protein